MDNSELSHLDASGRAKMVDVGDKPETSRRAVAKGEVQLSIDTLKAAKSGDLKKGDLRSAAELAGIMAAKQTANLIPLCHPLPLDKIDVEVTFSDDLPGVEIEASVSTRASTGVEMEALTAVAVAALTIYDMVKAIEKDAKLTNLRLVEKSGGQSGYFSAE
jgi:cyclic pyranopterin phosphate synthase